MTDNELFENAGENRGYGDGSEIGTSKGLWDFGDRRDTGCFPLGRDERGVERLGKEMSKRE